LINCLLKNSVDSNTLSRVERYALSTLDAEECLLRVAGFAAHRKFNRWNADKVYKESQIIGWIR